MTMRLIPDKNTDHRTEWGYAAIAGVLFITYIIFSFLVNN